MSIIAPVRNAIFAKLDEVTGLRVYRREVADPKVPAAIVQFPSLMERAAHPEEWTLNIPVLLIEQNAIDRAADEQLERLVDDIIELIDDDPDLGGRVASSQVVNVEGYQFVTVGGVEGFLGVTLTIEVFATTGATVDAAAASATGAASNVQ